MELTWLLIALFCVIILAILVLAAQAGQIPVDINGAHVLITGGSSGIGKEVAKEALKQGANVTIIARNALKLQETVVELENNIVRDGQKVGFVSVDVSACGTCADLKNSLQPSINNLGPIKVLIHCAGFSAPGRAHEVPESEAKRMIDVNYLGSLKVTQTLLPDMMVERNGVIIFTSSLAGLIGVYGLAAYSGSKFAVRGYAEALAMEVAPYGIKVSVNCPPDTDTPGLAEEDKTKPEETKLISEGSGLFQPDQVAKKMLSDGLKGKFLTSYGLDGWMLTNLSAGMSSGSLQDLLVQSGLLGLLRVIGWCYVQYFSYLINKCYKKRESSKKTN
jgi:3-dehydrosphinganine reductase